MSLRILNGRLAFLIADIDGFGKVFSFEEFVKADADPRHAFFWPIGSETSTTSSRDWLNPHFLTTTFRANPLLRGARTH